MSNSEIWPPRHELQLLGIAQKGQIWQIGMDDGSVKTRILICFRYTFLVGKLQAQSAVATLENTFFIDAGAWHRKFGPM